MANEKPMDRSNLEEALKRQFSSDDVVELLEKIDAAKYDMKMEAEEHPFFYSAVFNQISLIDDITYWISSDGVEKINNIAKDVKKEADNKRRIEEEKIAEEEKQKEYQEKLLEEKDKKERREEIRRKLDKIDFKNITMQDLEDVAKDMEATREEATIQEYNALVEAFGTVLGLDKNIVELQKLAKEQSENPESVLTEEQIKTIPEELIKGDKLDQEVMKTIDIMEGQVYTFINQQITIMEEPVTRENLNSFFERKMESMDSGLPKEFLQQIFVEQIFQNLEGKTVEEQGKIIEGRLKEYNSRKLPPNQKETGANETISGDTSFANISSALDEYDMPKTVSQMQMENDNIIKSQYEITQDPYREPEEQMNDTHTSLDEEIVDDPFAGLEDDFAAALAESDELVIDNLTNDQEENVISTEEVSEVSEYQEDTHETSVEENQTGLAGIFAGVKDKVANFFNRVNQKALPDPSNQKEVGGSLVPLNIRFRKALTRFSINTIGNAMQALGKLVGINNREQAKNTIQPDVITSEPNIDKQNQIEQSNINEKIFAENSPKITNTIDQYNMRNVNSPYYKSDEEIEAGIKQAIEQSQEAAKRAGNGEIVQTNEDMAKE